MSMIRKLFSLCSGYFAARAHVRAQRDHKRRKARTYARNKRAKSNTSMLKNTWAATQGAFIVADIETTGLSVANCEVLEIAAVLVDASGKIQAEFTSLVRVKERVPRMITELTGITQADVNREGRPIEQVMQDFLNFVATRPVFFHNASFDSRFLKAAAEKCGRSFSNTILCTLKMARIVWPDLRSHKLIVLANHIGAKAPTHRGLDDVKATLAVLLAARSHSEALAA